MKTKVRIQEQKTFNQYGYRQMFIQVLDKKMQGASLDVIGQITFQTDNNQEDKRWYGLRFISEIESYHYENMAKISKLAKYVSDNCDSSVQPDELLLAIGAERYFSYNGYFIPLSYVGLRYYKVFRQRSAGIEYYSGFFEANDILAQKNFGKLSKKNSLDETYSFKFEEVVPKYHRDESF